WKAAQAHPMGYSQFSFGYWSSVPPSLAAFGVDLPEGGNNG
ncbi:MAG TPA: sorbitol dehydrogenase, partial [Thermoanaerobaculia bacterium]|nr:sorbitol dehydrogenase [Thermoanaerobaculia bacterium]